MVPVKVRVPAPLFVSATAPPMVPENELAVALLTVKVAAAPLLVTVPVATPPSLRPAICWAKPPKS